MASKKRRTVGSYLKSARELREYFPQLAKYTKRKPYANALTGAEKAAIRRYEKIKAEHRNAVPISAKQAKALGKRALAGGGMRAIELDGFGRDNRLAVIRGRPVILGRNRRKVALVETSADYKAMMDAARNIQRRHDKPVSFWIWTKRGRSRRSFTLRQLADKLRVMFFTSYGHIGASGEPSDPEEYLMGLQYLA